MTSGMTRDEILSRARKIMALTNSTNPNEAARAAEKLAEFLDNHQITVYDVRDSQEKLNNTATVNVGDTEWKYADHSSVPLKTWKEYLIGALAKHFEVHVHIKQSWEEVTLKSEIQSKRRRVPYFVMVGDDITISIVRELYDWIVTQMELEAAREWKVQRSQKAVEGARLNRAGHHIDPLKFRNSFFMGAVDIITIRLRDWKVKETANNSTAIVLAKKDAITKRLVEMGVGKLGRTQREGRSMDGDSYRAGQAAGRRADMGTSGRRVSSGQKQLR